MTPKTSNNAAFSDMSCLGDQDGLTLGHKEVQLPKHLFNVRQAIATYNRQASDNKVLSAIGCIILQALITAIWEAFESAADMQVGIILDKDLQNTFCCKKSNSEHDTPPTWEDGSQMSAKDVAEYKLMPFPCSV